VADLFDVTKKRPWHGVVFQVLFPQPIFGVYLLFLVWERIDVPAFSHQVPIRCFLLGLLSISLYFLSGPDFHPLQNFSPTDFRSHRRFFEIDPSPSLLGTPLSNYSLLIQPDTVCLLLVLELPPPPYEVVFKHSVGLPLFQLLFPIFFRPCIHQPYYFDVLIVSGRMFAHCDNFPLGDGATGHGTFPPFPLPFFNPQAACFKVRQPCFQPIVPVALTLV